MGLNKASYISAFFGGISVVLILLCEYSFREFFWDIADYVNSIIPFPKYQVEYPVQGVQYLVPGFWLSDKNGIIFVLVVTSLLCTVSLFYSFRTKNKYGYNALIGFGFSMSLVSILYGVLVLSWLIVPG